MFDQIITECTIFNPTLERAFKVAPKEFVSAYQWFIDHENSEIDKLPHRLEKGFTVGGIPISRDSGIYSPSKSKVSYGLKQYALSVHTSNGNGMKMESQFTILMIPGQLSTVSILRLKETKYSQSCTTHF